MDPADAPLPPLPSAVPLCAWPAVPALAGAQALALQFQLERMQWLSPGALRAAQRPQLMALLDEAQRRIPHWRERLAAAGHDPQHGDPFETLARLAPLQRADVQSNVLALRHPAPPPEHGPPAEGRTSGSTGEPVRFLHTGLTQHFWRALTLREHLWQRRDFSAKLAAIRSNVEDGRAGNWGAATDGLIPTGPCVMLNIRADVDRQLDWLRQEDPAYLITHPSNLLALAERALDRGVRLPGLRQLRTFGEVLTPRTIARSREAWNVGIADVYSSEECGAIAFQCPAGRYHVQAENLVVEIVDDQGRPCAAGSIGRLLVTALHNFAQPLIRYALGDYAAYGAPCPCGRGLPVLERILGRQRNMLRLPDGTSHWPSFPEDRWTGIAPIRQLQAVQRRLDEVVLRVVAGRPLTGAERERLAAVFRETLRFPHAIGIEEVDAIPRRPNAKFEDFVSELA